MHCYVENVDEKVKYIICKVHLGFVYAFRGKLFIEKSSNDIILRTR